MRLFFLFLVLTLTACSLFDKPNNSIDALSISVDEVSKSIDSLEKQGLLDSDVERDAQIKLAYAHSLLLEPTADLFNDEACKGATDRVACVELILNSALVLLNRGQ